jgi:PBP1b-binding outer membrane lipoprotein LpoB
VRKSLSSLLILTIFLCGCSVNNEGTLASEIKSDEPIANRSKTHLEIGTEILSQVPDDHFVNYYKAVMNYRFLLKQSNADQSALLYAKENFDKTLK